VAPNDRAQALACFLDTAGDRVGGESNPRPESGAGSHRATGSSCADRVSTRQQDRGRHAFRSCFADVFATKHRQELSDHEAPVTQIGMLTWQWVEGSPGVRL
jgi:hypothetical protein